VTNHYELKETADQAWDSLQFEKAAGLYEQVAAVAPVGDRYALLSRAASCIAATDDWPEAGIMFVRIAERMESYKRENAYQNAWRCFAAAGMWRQAAEAIEAVQREDFERDIYDAAGKLWERAGDCDKAIASYESVGRFAKAERLRGIRSYNSDEGQSLFSWLHKYAERSPLGEAYWELGDICAAVRVYIESGRLSDLETFHSSWRDAFQSLPQIGPYVGPCQQLSLFELAGQTEKSSEAREEVIRAERDALFRIVDQNRYVPEENRQVPDGASPTDYIRYISTMRYDYIESCADAFIKAGQYKSAQACLEQALVEYKRAGNEWIHRSPQTIRMLMAVTSYLAGDFSTALRHLCESDYIGADRAAFEALVHMGLHDYRLAAESAAAGIKSLIASEYDHSNTYTVCERLVTVASLYGLADDEEAKRQWFRKAEEMERRQGQWADAVYTYSRFHMFDEVERICREEDELDVAAYLYERAGQQENAARILEEMAGIHPERARTEPTEEREPSVRPGMTSMGCPACSAEVPVGDSFCGECGHAIGRICPNCGAETKPDKKFCGQCGQAIANSR